MLVPLFILTQAVIPLTYHSQLLKAFETELTIPLAEDKDAYFRL